MFKCQEQSDETDIDFFFFIFRICFILDRFVVDMKPVPAPNGRSHPRWDARSLPSTLRPHSYVTSMSCVTSSKESCHAQVSFTLDFFYTGYATSHILCTYTYGVLTKLTNKAMQFNVFILSLFAESTTF